MILVVYKNPGERGPRVFCLRLAVNNYLSNHLLMKFPITPAITDSTNEMN